MRNAVIILILLLAIPCAGAEKTKFFLTWKYTAASQDDSAKLSLFCDHFEYKFYQGIEKYFPCATKTSLANIAVALDNERQKQLLGVDDGSTMESLAGAMGYQYLVSLKLTQAGQNLFMFVSCHHMAQARMLVNVMEQGPMDEGAFDVVDKLADNFFDQLLKYEICPYKGRIKVQVTTDLNVDVSREYPVYCNQQDRVYKMHYKETKHSEHFWTFEKETKVWARSFIDYSVSEESEREIDDGCYSCPQGKTRRYYHETTTKTGKINEVSQESELYGKKVDDARVEISFNDDGTYTISIAATSKQSEISETRYQTAESWCDTGNKPPETIINMVDIPLTYVFGPYKGTARDESLTAHPDPVIVTDPVSGEKRTYEISFDLLRE